jgi:hypothetical protein
MARAANLAGSRESDQQYARIVGRWVHAARGVDFEAKGERMGMRLPPDRTGLKLVSRRRKQANCKGLETR